MFCRNCGAGNNDSAKFCIGCGAPLQAAPAQPQEPQPYVQQPVYQQPVYQQQPYVQSQYQQRVYTQQPVYAQQPAAKPAGNLPKWVGLIAHLTMVLGAVLLVLVLVFPSITATDYYKSELEWYGDREVIDGYTGEDLKNVSPIELIGIMGEEEGEEASIVLIVIAVFFGLFALLNLLFAGIKKPIPVFIFTVIAAIIALIQDALYNAAGMLDIYYKWGFGHYMIFVGAIIAIAGGIFYLVVRNKLRRA